MASVRSETRKDGTTAHRVFFRHNGRQTCYTFDSAGMAETFKTAVNQLGSGPAIAIHRLERAPRTDTSVTVTEWVKGHIDHLSGAQPDTVAKYRAYLSNDIAPTIGAIPLDQLTDRDVSRWITGMAGSAKTLANKQRFLSSALGAAVKAKAIPTNPAAGAHVPRSERRQKVCLSKEQFDLLLTEVTEPWRPLVRFLVASGCRWGEATALKPTDVDRSGCSVRISRAWKYSPDTGYILGPTKTAGSERTIDVAKSVLDNLDYTHEHLFTNPGNGAGGPSLKRPGAGGPVRIHNFGPNVWRPACARAKLDPRPRVHDLRHTCASWMVQEGVSLAVVQAHLGHEDIRTTIGTYTHLDRRGAKAAADILGKLLG